jgi:ribulose-5-phosphate 4-epimerase/fuculose-1-phosphate aldolase
MSVWQGSEGRGLALSEVRREVSEAEWQARLDAAACYRLIAHFGMSDLVYNHITVRVPGAEDRILINPFGWLYEEITASSLITIDLEGRILLNPHPDLGINAAGYVIHSAIHRARPDVACVIHTQTALRCFPVAYHDYEGPALSLEERERLAADLGSASVMILRNHGLLTVGASAAEAFNAMYWLEMACRAQVAALAGGGALHRLPEDVIARSIHLYQPGTRRRFGLLEWPAMLRLLDRLDPSWRS